jgi:hypothetical protein
MFSKILTGVFAGLVVSCAAVSTDHFLFQGKYQKMLVKTFQVPTVAPKDRRGLKIVDSSLKGWGGFQYSLGLNTCPHPFSWEKQSCTPGGLYYTRQENINGFLHYGNPPVLLVVSVPEGDNRVVEMDTGSDVKFKSKHLIVEKIFPLMTTCHEELVANGITSISEKTLDSIQNPQTNRHYSDYY